MTPSILSVGTGNMGAAIAQALIPSFPVKIWNRTRTRPQVDSLIAAGAVFERSLPAGIAAASVVIICVIDYAAIIKITSSIPESEAKSVWSDKTVVVLTNGTPKDAQRMADTFSALDVGAYFDGGVMVTPQIVGTPHSFVLVSGETQEKLNETGTAEALSKIGKVQYVGPEAGAASRLDVAALTAMYGMFNGAFVAMGLLKKQKAAVHEEKVKILAGVENVVVPVLAALVPYVGLIAKAMDEETWDDDLGNPMSMQLAAVQNIMQACEDEGVNAGGMWYFAGLMEKVVQEHGGEGGIAVLGTYLLE